LSPCTRPMRLEGTEALELYLVEIEQNLALLAEHITLLQGALADHRRLLHRIATMPNERQTPPVH
jgi:hypothetical protein